MTAEPHSSRLQPPLIIIGAFLVLILVAFLVNQAFTEDSAESLEPAPEASFDLLGGGQATLEEFEGRPLVLNFWATWCAPCRQELPDLAAAHTEHGDEVAFLGMNVADNGNEALALLQETGVAYPSGVDPVGEIQDAFRTITMPTTVFIDADGNIVDLHQGIISAEQLEAAIAELR